MTTKDPTPSAEDQTPGLVMSEQATAKEQVLAWVRSKNPDSMELKFGCKVCFQDGNICNYCRSMMGNRRRGRSEISTILCCENGGTSPDYDVFENEYEILGSDMHLNDLLIALRHRRSAGEYGCLCDELIGIERDETCCCSYEDSPMKYDLTKDLHSQKPEFYEALLPLLTNA